MKKKNIFSHYILPLIFIIFVLLIFFYPLLFGGKVFFDGDAALGFYPVFSFLKQAISNISSLNLWLPEILSGFPIYASLLGFFHFFAGIFYWLLPFLTAYSWLTFINFFLGACFTYLFVKNLNLSRIAALISSLVYILSWTINHTSSISATNAYFVLPLLFLSLLKISQGKYKYTLLGGIGLGLGWLAGHYNLIVFALCASLFYVFFFSYVNYDRKKSFFKNSTIINAFIIICLISLIIGFFQLIPSVNLNFLGSRAEGVAYQESVAVGLGPVDLINYLFPYFKIPHFSWGSQSILYIGFLPLFFFLVSIFYQRNKNILFFIFLFSFSFLSAIIYSPLFWFMNKLPIFEYFRVSLRWMYIGSFAAAILAAYGYQYFLKNFQNVRKLINAFK